MRTKPQAQAKAGEGGMKGGREGSGEEGSGEEGSGGSGGSGAKGREGYSALLIHSFSPVMV